MYDWLTRQSRSNTRLRFGGRGFRQLLQDDRGLADWKRTGDGRWSVSDGVLRCVTDGASAGDNILTLQEPLGEFEFHFDVGAPNGAPFEVILESADASDQSIRISVEWPERGTGGVIHRPSGVLLGKSTALGQRALRADSWNDVRVALRQQRLQVHVNGVLLFDVHDPLLAGQHRVGLRLAGGEEGKLEWRDLRLWSAEQTAAQD